MLYQVRSECNNLAKNKVPRKKSDIFKTFSTIFKRQHYSKQTALNTMDTGGAKVQTKIWIKDSEIATGFF